MLDYKIGDILIDTLNPYYNNTGKNIILNENDSKRTLLYKPCYDLEKCKCEILEIYKTDITISFYIYIRKFPITKNKKGENTKPINCYSVVRVFDKTQDRVNQEFIKRFIKFDGQD
jgi:hypothetical protein